MGRRHLADLPRAARRDLGARRRRQGLGRRLAGHVLGCAGDGRHRRRRPAVRGDRLSDRSRHATPRLAPTRFRTLFDAPQGAQPGLAPRSRASGWNGIRQPAPDRSQEEYMQRFATAGLPRAIHAGAIAGALMLVLAGCQRGGAPDANAQPAAGSATTASAPTASVAATPSVASTASAPGADRYDIAKMDFKPPPAVLSQRAPHRRRSPAAARSARRRRSSRSIRRRSRRSASTRRTRSSRSRPA